MPKNGSALPSKHGYRDTKPFLGKLVHFSLGYSALRNDDRQRGLLHSEVADKDHELPIHDRKIDSNSAYTHFNLERVRLDELWVQD